MDISKLSNRQKRNRAMFHAYLSASQHLLDIVSAYEGDDQDEILMNEEYTRIAKRLERQAWEYRERFPA
jgi:hypothetical protein